MLIIFFIANKYLIETVSWDESLTLLGGFHPKASWLCASGTVVRQSVMAEGFVTEKLLSHASKKAEREHPSTRWFLPFILFFFFTS